jgi:phosphatidylglycerophosphate synthase
VLILRGNDRGVQATTLTSSVVFNKLTITVKTIRSSTSDTLSLDWPFMNLTVKTSDERINDILLGPLERPVLRWLCERMPPWVTPDILTAIGLLGGVITATAYWLCTINRNFLWLSDIGLAVNWFGDSLDGNIARYRKIERFQYGYFIDHTVDTLTQTLICAGLGLSHYIRFQYALLVLVGYLQLGILTYVDTAVTGTFKISYGKIGPTEIRFILVAVNLIFYFAPNPTLRLPFLQIALFDVVALFFAAAFFTYFIVFTLIRAAALDHLDHPTAKI